MLSEFMRKIAYKIRRKLQLKTITLGGVILTTDLNDIPKSIRKQLFQKRYEHQELALVRAALGPSDRVLEVGAGIGFISIVCSKICGAENVISYEPNPAMRPVIEKNFSLNGLTANLRSRVLSTTPGEVKFFFSDGVLSSSLVDRFSGEPTTVEADGISDVVSDLVPSVIVMDAEGAEIELLRNCSLNSVKKIVIEMHPHIVGTHAIEKLSSYLVENGFRLKQRMGKVFFFQRI